MPDETVGDHSALERRVVVFRNVGVVIVVGSTCSSYNSCFRKDRTSQDGQFKATGGDNENWNTIFKERAVRWVESGSARGF